MHRRCIGDRGSYEHGPRAETLPIVCRACWRLCAGASVAVMRAFAFATRPELRGACLSGSARVLARARVRMLVRMLVRAYDGSHERACANACSRQTVWWLAPDTPEVKAAPD
eukprot:6190734-Pleurochrysis_carterae.AAC.1